MIRLCAQLKRMPLAASRALPVLILSARSLPPIGTRVAKSAAAAADV